MSGRSSDLALGGLVVACHLFAGLLYGTQRDTFGLPTNWDLQFVALLSASLALSLFAVASGEKTRAKAALAVAFLSYLLLGYPIPMTSGIQLVLGFPLMLESVALFPKPACFFAGGGCVLTVILVRRTAFAWGHAIPPTPPEQLALFAFILAFLFAVSLLLWELDASRRRAFREIERLDFAIGRISDINASFQDALAQAEEASSLRERNRITREIHDIVGYALTNQQMMLEAALLLTDESDERLRELLGMARRGVAEGLRDARRTLYELRRNESHSEDPGFGVLLKVVRNFEAVTGVHVAVDFTNARGELSRAAWLSLYRLIQESMINAFRHGNAKNIAIIFRENESDFYVRVRDDGCGAANVIEGIGLKGMRERTVALGGELFAGNAADGFVVSARLPKGEGKGGVE